MDKKIILNQNNVVLWTYSMLVFSFTSMLNISITSLNGSTIEWRLSEQVPSCLAITGFCFQEDCEDQTSAKYPTKQYLLFPGLGRLLTDQLA